MGIGKLRCHVIDVDDLDIAEAFYSELTGLPVILSHYTGRFSYLGQPDPWRHEVILQLVSSRKGPDPNRSHIDIWVANIDRAITQITAIGGSLKRGPTIYPRPHSFPGKPAVIDWAVMRDPFGNEFCLVTALTDEESEAVGRAAEAGPGDDHAWRVAAGRTSTDRKASQPGGPGDGRPTVDAGPT